MVDSPGGDPQQASSGQALSGRARPALIEVIGPHPTADRFGQGGPDEPSTSRMEQSSQAEPASSRQDEPAKNNTLPPVIPAAGAVTP